MFGIRYTRSVITYVRNTLVTLWPLKIPGWAMGTLQKCQQTLPLPLCFLHFSEEIYDYALLLKKVAADWVKSAFYLEE